MGENSREEQKKEKRRKRHRQEGSTVVRTSYSSRPHRVQFLEKENKIKMQNEKLRKKRIF